MKPVFYLSLIAVLSCNEQSKPATQTVTIDSTNATSVQNTKIDNSRYYTNLNTVIIAMEPDDTMRYSKAQFNEVVDKHPEFFEDFPNDPDALYSNNKDDNFYSEAGQDNYYATYAYFLKQKNGVKKYANQREKLINIFLDINHLFGMLQYGGTYFGHQYTRILGYAEYSVYILTYGSDEKTYDISKQKELYIKSLRQLIDDESKIDFESMGKEKIERTKELNKIVDDLNRLITDIFFLRRAQEFQYRHYQYF
jgi:hypothetical protein